MRIPDEAPDTARERNNIVRRAAEWLRAAAAIGAAFDPEARAVWAMLEAAAWVAGHLPEIRSYLDARKTLEELQNAVDDRQPGYEIHHIVEAQYGSFHPDSNARIFADRLESRENLVRIPKWKHVEISSWYSRLSEEDEKKTPRSYLRGRSWEAQYAIGIQALRQAGVLK